MKKIGILGCGKIGKALLHEIKEQQYGEVVFAQDPYVDEAELKAVFPQIQVIRSAEDSFYQAVDMIIESATADVLAENIERILKNADLLMFSVTAFSDLDFQESVQKLGKQYEKHVLIPHGAILGLDGILDGRKAWESISIETIKTPESLGCRETERTVLYEGPTRAACRLYPRNVNVHAAIALAGIGFDRTVSRIVADPSVHTNTHLIHVKGAGMEMKLHVSSFADGGVTGTYTPLSACGSLKRVLDQSEVIRMV